MTVAEQILSEQHPGDGSNDEFEFGFRIESADELVVTLVQDSTEESTPQTLTTHYTVSIDEDTGTGSVTMVTAPPVGYTLDLRPVYELLQPTRIRNQGRFLPEVHEATFDRLTSFTQYLYRLIRRSIRLPDVSDSQSGELTPRSSWLDRFLYVNASGTLEPAAALALTVLTQSIIAALLKPQTLAENAAGVIPTDNTVDDILLNRYGGDPTGATFSDTALTKAISVALKDKNRPIKVKGGNYKFQDEHRIPQGIKIICEGSQGSTVGFGTSFEHHSNGNFLVWDGSGDGGASFRGTGGGIQHALIVKADGFAGGYAINILATDDNHRPGEMQLEDLTVYASGSGQWARAINFDGTACVTPGAKGVRDISLFKVRVAGCSDDNKYINISQGVHVHGSYVQIDTGNGTGIAGMTIDGDSSGICLAAVEINGVVQVNDTATEVNLQGRVNTLDVNNASAIGSFIGSGSLLFNESKSFKIVSSRADAFAAKRTTSQANVTGDGTSATILYDSERYDKNDSFDPATGIFIAKVAGLYQFNAIVSYSGLTSSHTLHETVIIHRDSGGSTQNTIAVTGNPWATATPSGTSSVRLGCQLDLAAGDSVRVQGTVSNGAAVVDITGLSTTYTSFSGALL